VLPETRSRPFLFIGSQRGELKMSQRGGSYPILSTLHLFCFFILFCRIAQSQQGTQQQQRKHFFTMGKKDKAKSLPKDKGLEEEKMESQHDEPPKESSKKRPKEVDDDEMTTADDSTSKRTKTTENNDDQNITDLVADKPNFYSQDPNDVFSSLPLSDKTLAALQGMNMTRMTQIQAKAIPPLLAGKDLIGAAKTGSGKTLAFVIPIIELLFKAKFTPKNGTGAIILSPTRELAMQIYGVLQECMLNPNNKSDVGHHTQTYGLIMGGANRKTEADKLAKGVNCIVATPGRLLDHLQNSKGFNVRNLLALCMDEADRILEQGFEDDLRSILKLLPKERQTMLFSATQTKKVQDLVRLSVNPKNSIFVEVENESNLATAAGLEQGFVTVASDKRFLLLFTFLKKNRKKKIMVFFSSCNSVKFHAELLNYIDVPVLDIHGRQKQVKRTTTFFQFCKSDSGTLLCTDVAARGLDIPKVSSDSFVERYVAPLRR
jgi:ATP-dependent RNA helicase DDX18/HAS1